MTYSTRTKGDAQSDSDRRRRRKALLAGGLVLGVGATMTLAAWSDDVFVSGTFAAGNFGIQGAVDSSASSWAEYDTSGTAASMSFTVNPTAMTPGASVYAPLSLRVDPAKNSYAANVTLPTAPTGPTTPSTANTAFFNNLQISLFNVPPANCNQAGVSAATPIAPFSNAALSTTTSSTITTLPTSSAPYSMCFRITLKSDAPTTVMGGQTGALQWKFSATSA